MIFFLAWTRFQRSEYLIGRTQYKWYDALVSVTAFVWFLFATISSLLIKFINKIELDIFIASCSMSIVNFVYDFWFLNFISWIVRGEVLN